MTDSEQGMRTVPWLLFRGTVLRPIETLIGAVQITVGVGTPARLRTSGVCDTVLIVLWVTLSWLSDRLVLGHQASPVAALVAVGAWNGGLRHILRVYGVQDRFHQTRAAIAGVSIWIWGLSSLLAIAGLSQMVVVGYGCAVAIRGYGRVMDAALGGRAETLYTSVAIWLLALSALCKVATVAFGHIPL